MAYKITVYTAPGCPYCTKAKNYFRQLGLNFTEIDVSKDYRKAQELVRKTGQMGVPVIEIGNQIIIGFDKDRIDRILGVR
ncbi:glutaredoxin family protein [Pseudothermotoga thermarum]|uniref:Glutaredoxin-like protein, YruB-family n=1 Tax=Pseudothermotoga thermarum DSM 5069 TaxID=688269 RepID=F7YXM5_9THEM|nr:Uxx-star family glutaredoxin-like (seleno)protein [Pseudothermotoga thermarum]AEH50667.1 glutaredoxin-like protein, YruB-family [Pseudothermotoga thermarum DSM 5069]